MSKVALDAKVISIDLETRMAIEQAKRLAAVDYSYTCFKGKTHFSKADLAKSMWLAKEKAKEEYI